ncbi:MFS general substrate transporter [Daedaleopsis nitida]|nr:MFS general substrate transporter [Daedaleopsis nitida]
MSASSVDEKLSPTADVPSTGTGVLYGSERTVTEVDPRKILRKLDLRLLPFVSLLYLLSFLDRANIGNAKVAGLARDLNLTGLEYNLCAAIFFIPYCFFERRNLALKVFSPSKWIPLIMFLWGAVMVSMAFVKSFSGLLAARIFLGITEAGLFPGITFYFDCSRRIRGLLAFSIERMEGIGGLHGWSWIFLLEGLLTSVVAAIAYFCMYDYPENASILTGAERKWLINTIRTNNTGLSKSYKAEFIMQALRDPHLYLMAVIYLFVLIPSYAFALFLPTIIKDLGFSASHAQLLSVPPNAAGCLFTIVSGVLSDKFRARRPFILAGSATALIGYSILFTTKSPGAGCAGVMIAACGLFPSVACILAWTGGNVGGEVKRAVVIAMVIGLGNLGGVASSFIYRPQDSPRYLPGHATDISCLCVAILLCSIAVFDFARLNRTKAKQCAKERITEEQGSNYAEMGDASPLYKCVIFLSIP